MKIYLLSTHVCYILKDTKKSIRSNQETVMTGIPERITQDSLKVGRIVCIIYMYMYMEEELC